MEVSFHRKVKKLVERSIIRRNYFMNLFSIELLNEILVNTRSGLPRCIPVTPLQSDCAHCSSLIHSKRNISAHHRCILQCLRSCLANRPLLQLQACSQVLPLPSGLARCPLDECLSHRLWSLWAVAPCSPLSCAFADYSTGPGNRSSH